MNLVQIRMLQAHGYEFTKTELKPRQIGGEQYVAVAIKNGKAASAAGRSLPEAEQRLVMSITAPGDDRNIQQWKYEEQFLDRMAKRYAR